MRASNFGKHGGPPAVIKIYKSGAWQILCTALGTHRASWVARVLNPTTNPVNNAAFKTNPSAKIIDATNIVDAVNTAFKKLPLNGIISRYCKGFSDQIKH